MSAILALAVSFPTVVFTVLLGLSLIYWVFVLVGAVDLDGGAEGSLEGATKGVLEGATKGALEGATKGVLEGSAKAALEGGADGLDGADVDGGVLATLASALRLKDAPVTVILSFFSLFGWLGSSLAMMSLGGALGLPSWAIGIPVFLVTSIVALLLTSLAVRPIAPLFQTRHAQRHVHLVGKVAVVSTGNVDEKFGQATLEDGGAGLILQVRADPKLGLRRGDRCLIVDEEGGMFRIEKMTDLLADPGSHIHAEALREAQAEVEALAAEPKTGDRARRG